MNFSIEKLHFYGLNKLFSYNYLYFMDGSRTVDFLKILYKNIRSLKNKTIIDACDAKVQIDPVNKVFIFLMYV